MEGKMHLSGQLSDWSINDLLQIMQVTKKTGSLDIDAERRGRIHFRDGSVTGAELTGSGESHLGTDRGSVADVLYVLSSLSEGSFAVGAADGPDGSGWSVEDVLSDVEALRDLEGELTEAGLFEAPGLRLVESIEAPVTIDPEHWSSLVALVRPFGFGELEERSGKGGAVRILHALLRLGVAETVEREQPSEVVVEEDESGWLDRLAEDIVPESDEPTWVEEVGSTEPELEPAADAEPELEPLEPVVAEELTPARPAADVRGVSAPASTTLTDGVYDEIRRLRSKVADS